MTRHLSLTSALLASFLVACAGQVEISAPAPGDPGHDFDGDGATEMEGDCDDLDPSVGPGTGEECNGVDDDCDGQIDDGLDTSTWYLDADQDSHGDPASGAELCEEQPEGRVLDGDDCDDLDPLVHPDAVEVCNGEDDDCNDALDDVLLEDAEELPVWYRDVDRDGYGDSEDSVDAFCPPEGYVDNDDDCDDTSDALTPADLDGDGSSTCDGDCDDANPAIHPGATEVCNGIDDDCTGLPGNDEGDGDADGSMPCEGDCDDADPARNPGVEETCNAIDDDCDGLVDQTFDLDGDGFPAGEGCAGAWTTPDCDDTDATVSPGAAELCDGIDGDCDGAVPAGELDDDGDGLADCEGDCDDGAVDVFPGHVELCNGIDDDCDPSTTASGGEVDLDGDGSLSCVDCDDGDAANLPGGDEGLDGQDNDCDGLVDGDDGDFPVPGMDFVLLDPGSFVMGCVPGRDDVDVDCQDSARPPHEVILTHHLWVAETETTQEQWETLGQTFGWTNPSYFGPNGAGDACGMDCPVEQVNWYEALEFANAMSDEEGLADCYVLSDCTGSPGAGMACDEVSLNPIYATVYDCEGYRLPTEAEWEYAARAGEQWRWAGSDEPDDVAWHGTVSGSSTHPVGELLANAWGLFDMSGNVVEWTGDWHMEPYDSPSPTVDPAGGLSEGNREARGGRWSVGIGASKVVTRTSAVASFSDWDFGFRLVRSLPCTPDADGDGFCEQIDCDDTDPAVHPTAEELPDGLDNDCDGEADITHPAPGMPFVLLDPGTFTMGCLAGRDDVDGGCDADESPAHDVTLTRYTWMAQTETTQGQFEALMGYNPSYFSTDGVGGYCGPDCPVETVSWHEAAAFANALTAGTGLTPCYTCTGSGETAECTPEDPYACTGYRLPTEAEWEYAARAGQDYAFAGSDVAADVAWYDANSGGMTQPVAAAQVQANGWDLYDMSGNVQEWTWDWYAPYLSPSVSDPAGPSSGASRVYRGGDWISPAGFAGVARRSPFAPGNRSYNLGFRLARSLP